MPEKVKLGNDIFAVRLDEGRWFAGMYGRVERFPAKDGSKQHVMGVFTTRAGREVGVWFPQVLESAVERGSLKPGIFYLLHNAGKKKSMKGTNVYHDIEVFTLNAQEFDILKDEGICSPDGLCSRDALGATFPDLFKADPKPEHKATV